ncbi:MAG: hypothetical protein ALECFALPRED_006650 [Alectoria fallacina]|uniref:Uncharacterized protein n=1 Tax=Alectoria fallacina TaxID=1903189 RepID=A0A8H3G3M9_9LECA|nr:MAG: hypothetical protein ALECFALPRED_006650 [Alectoria fallacina]
MNRLGDGTDFELIISSEDTNEEYNDDTSIIPRSTTVIAKRLPAAKVGRGGAARYVSGKIPQNAKSFHRMEAPASKPSSSSAANGATTINGAQNEEERIVAMFKLGADQWAQQQQEMANATPVHRAGPNKGKPANLPDHPPPPGYICYRCGEKGHWIMVCPTNDDPAYDGRPRVKRTTGIPRSFLKTVQKPTSLVNDGTMDDTKQPAGIMVNAEGEWVIAEPDKAAWAQFQAKAKVAAVAQEAAARGSKELQDRGLECSIDKRLFADPTKTPCCQSTFCRDCIINTLLENDLRCPECSTENVPIDDLVPDEQMTAKIRSYEEEKAADQVREESSKSTVKGGPQKAIDSPHDSDSVKIPPPQKFQTVSGTSRKRPAESELVNERKVPGPAGGVSKQNSVNATKSESHQQKPAVASNMPANQQPSLSNGNFTMPQAMNHMAFPNMNGFMGVPMSMAPPMNMNTAMPNPMLMANGPFMGNDWNNMWGGGFPQQSMNMAGGGFQSGMRPNAGYNQYNPMGSNFMNMNGVGMNGQGMNGVGMGSFANQQRTTFSTPRTNEEDSAYFRKPVNPHRHQAKRNVQRPTDYREI